MICISINEPNFDKCIESARKYELAEIRIDLCKLNIEQVQKIFSEHNNLIATCRPGYLNEKERIDILKEAIKAGAKYVDIEYETSYANQQEIINTANQYKCDAIISYHNFNETPSQKQLEIIVEQCFSCGADIVKIACMVNKIEDNSILLSLYQNGKRMVVFGMGELGKISRIISPFLGAEFTFASVDDTLNTAPGQISFDKLNYIHNEIRKLI